MTSKIHLNKLIQISNNEEAALANINANVDILNDVIDDYVSRSAKVPTQMQAPLDMGSQKIINVGTPTDENDVVRYKDVKDALDTLEQVQEDLQEVENAVTRANNAATSANQYAVDAYDSKEIAVAAKIDAQAADEHITELLTEDYPEITTVANNISDVQTVAGVAGDVTTVAGVATEVSALGGIASDITAVAGVTSDVTTVAGVASDVTTVAGVSTAVQAVEDNLTAVQNAAQNATDAADSAELAHKWATSSTVVESGQYGASYYALRAANYASGAETARDTARDWATKMDGPVSGSDYSSEYYAAQAAQSATTAADIVASMGTVMRYKGSVATYADLPSTGNTVGDVYNVTDTGKNYAWTTESTWDDFGGAVTVSLAACTDVDLSSPTNGQVLSYNDTTQKWENSSIAIPTVDQTYDGTSANAQSGVAINGAGFLKNTGNSSYSNLGIIGTTNASSGRNRQVAIGYGATTSNSDSVAIGYNANSGANTQAIAIGSGASSYSSGIAIGYNSSVTSLGGIAMNGKTNNGIAIGTGNTSTSTGAQAVAIGGNATGTYAVTLGKSTTATATSAVSLGYMARTSAAYAIQIGYGTNSTANTLSVGLSDTNNYELLSSDGTVPFARQAKAIIEGASDPDTATVGTVGLLYRNTTDGGIFKCTDTTGGVYTWEELGAGGSSASYDPVTKTITL